MKYELFWGWVGMKNSNVGHDNFEILMRPPSEDIMTSQRKGKKKKAIGNMKNSRCRQPPLNL